MRNLLYALGGLAVVVISFVATHLILDRVSPRCPAGAVTQLQKPFIKGPGVAGYIASAPLLTSMSDSTSPNPSPAVLCEDGALLGPPHSAHADIGSKGQGRFSHWGDGFVFSASDNSDPNKNGRTYLVVTPQ